MYALVASSLGEVVTIVALPEELVYASKQRWSGRTRWRRVRKKRRWVAVLSQSLNYKYIRKLHDLAHTGVYTFTVRGVDAVEYFVREK